MQEDLSSKEHKWTAALSKLQEQVEIQKEQKQGHKDAGGSQQQGTQVDSCPLQASGIGRYKKREQKQDHKDAGVSQQQGTQVDSCPLQASGTGRYTKRTGTRSQRCRRISAARNTSGQLPSPSFRNRWIQREQKQDQ